MTLVELLIVLGLMAAIATVALTTLDSMGDRTRMDTTRNRLDMIEQAIVGDGLTPGRFISDMGRLPVVHATSSETPPEPEAGKELIELWDAPDEYTVMNGHSFEGLDSESEELEGLVSYTVDLPTGWRGPYVQVPGSRLYDGFGNAFVLNQQPAPLLPPSKENAWSRVSSDISDMIGQEITGVASWGRDGVADTAQPQWEDADEGRLLAGNRSIATLIVSIRIRATDPTPAAWLPPAPANDWQADTNYSVGSVVRPTEATSNDLYYLVSGSGESGNGEPAWNPAPEEDPGHVVEDAGLQWQFWKKLYRSEHVNRMRVVVFAPFADPALPEEPLAMRTREIAAWYDATNAATDWDHVDSEDSYFYFSEDRAVVSAGTAISEVTLSGLPPGTRKLLVYGYYRTDAEPPEIFNAHSSGLQTIELNPGVNHLTVYLNQPL